MSADRTAKPKRVQDIIDRLARMESELAELHEEAQVLYSATVKVGDVLFIQGLNRNRAIEEMSDAGRIVMTLSAGLAGAKTAARKAHVFLTDSPVAKLISFTDVDEMLANGPRR